MSEVAGESGKLFAGNFPEDLISDVGIMKAIRDA